MTVHSFQESLAKSHAQEDAPWWFDVYSKAFPGFASMVSVRSDGWAQRGGIDRVITLKSGRTVTVDEKVREKPWPDILLERWSDKRRETAGWMQKDLACDYIAYAFIPTQRCYVLPFLQLRAAWLRHGREWIQKAESQQDGFKIITANNGSYVTENVAVPIADLMDALAEAQKIEWAA